MCTAQQRPRVIRQRGHPMSARGRDAAYLETIVTELLEERDALLILAKGLGLHVVLTRIVERHHRPEELVFLINSTHEQERQLLLTMAKAGLTPPAVLNNECPAQDRIELYLAGGVILVTARIFVVDLLCDRVPIEQATGIIVANAHRVSEGSNVAFIARIFRQRNRTAFLKGLSDDAHGFTRGFAKVEKVMRMLQVKRLQLWPRFHVDVSAVLDEFQPVVEELSVPLSARSEKLQQALLEAVNDCLKELRGLNQAVDVSQLSVENALFRSFDQIVRMQLEPIWHRTSRRTRALVADLQTLRKLLNYLVAFDCVSYYEYIETIFEAASSLHPSERPHWLLNCSEAVKTLARDRVYELQRSQQFLAPPPLPPHGPSADTGSDAAAAATDAAGAAIGLSSSVAPLAGGKQAPPLSVRCVLESSPKWAALQELVREIGEKRAAGAAGCVLIVVRDERTGDEVRELLAHGARPLLEANFVRWVFRRRRSQVPTSTVLSSRQHETRLLRAAADKIAAKHAQQPAPPRALHQVELPDAAAGAAGVAGAAASAAGGGGGAAAAGGRAARGGRSARGSRGVSGRGGKQPARAPAGAVASGIERRESVEDESPAAGPAAFGVGGVSVVGGASGELDAASISEHFALLDDPEDATLICTHAAVASEVLEELAPRYVVLYDPDPAFIRAIELAQAMSPASPIHVYFLMQQASVEEQRYRSALRIEREAFGALVLDKGRMVITEDWDEPPSIPKLPGESTSSGGSGNAATRHGGGRAATSAKGSAVVIVDVREFRSALPNMLHLHGMVVRPVTLEVGDYILSPEVCVERKAIPDLIHSLGSGRLYNQAEAMTRYYKRPALLIECEEGRPFGLINPNELGPEISPQSILSKLSLLMLHFPKLRLLWSRSPAHTVAIFVALKEGLSEPDAATAASVGAPNAPGAEQAFNMAPQDFLRQLPGVFAHNYRRLMNSVLNLEELGAKSLDELAAIIGAQNGRLLHDFLHREA